MTDADWLRARPDLVNAWFRIYEFNDSFTALESILPLLRAAIRADVVRELAGDAPTEVGGAPWDLLRPDVQHDIDQLRAAAHAQGRAAGREEAAGDIEDADPHLAEFIRKRSLP